MFTKFFTSFGINLLYNFYDRGSYKYSIESYDLPEGEFI
jgi:hypothetical protein